MDPCGSSLPMIINDKELGNILSPNYPNEYPDEAYCEWVIKAREGMIVQLTILEFDTEEG